ncbi:acyltransferase family protein [Sphingomonas sp. Leaf4]|uniref:acyltransferase family protein n=1 Tax=Sphingomonas sp. Leaf4 TaxID=2876553 RepID=UPI0022A6CFC6|nr:acyltransferase [Sphingomonas sp. Leaf4]
MQAELRDTYGRRIPALDSIRGIAALAVCMHHIAYLWADIGQVQGAQLKALRAFIMWGHPAVLVFFALSGFVLFVSHRPDQPKPYGRYLVGRVFRIYPAYIAVYLAVLALTLLVSMDAAQWTASWAKQVPPRADLSAPSIFRTVSLIFAVEGDTRFNVVSWSLVHEMRFSLVFPLMALLLCRFPRSFVGLSAVMYAISLAILPALGLKPDYLIAGYLGADIFITLHYLPCFGAGMLAALFVMRNRTIRVPTIAVVLLLILSMAVPRYVHDDLALAIWGSLIIIASIANARFAAVLDGKILQYLGRISYSLYLVHLPVAWLTFFLLDDRLPLAVVAMVSLLASAIFATVLERFVERTGVQVGKVLLKQQNPPRERVPA